MLTRTVCFAVLAILAGPALGEVPQTVQYQGVLLDASGLPVDGTANIDLAVWKDPVSTDPADRLYEETHSGVPVVGGVFTVPLGGGTTGDVFSADLFSEAGRWLEVIVNGETLTPRQAILSVPFALQASRFTGQTCLPTESVSGWDSDGSPVCSGSQVVVGSAGGFGNPAIAIGTDGLPVIAFRDSAADQPRVVHCGNASCTTGNSTEEINFGTDAGDYMSIAIGSDGFPVMSFERDGELGIAHCDDLTCSSASTMATSVIGGTWTSIAIGTDGLPVVSFTGSSNQFRVIHCPDIACSGALSSLQVAFGTHGSIAIGSDGLPVMSYRTTAGNIQVSRCATLACATVVGVNLIEAGADSSKTSIAIGPDGFPIVAYTVAAKLKIAHCLDVACASVAIAAPPSAVPNPAGTAAAFGPDGTLWVAAGGVQLVRCSDSACSNPSTVYLRVGSLPSVAIGTDGLPVVTYNEGLLVRVFH